MPADHRPVPDGQASSLPAAYTAAGPASSPSLSWSVVDLLARKPMLLLSAWTGIWFAILARHGGIAWIFFVKGSSLLFTGNYNGHNRPGFMHFYANYPGFQIGPLAFGVAQVIRNVVPGQPVGPYQGVVLAQLIMSAMGLVTLVVIRRIALLARPELARQRGFLLTFLAGGAVF